MKKIAAINDLSGIGRCSLSVALPIISALKVQCCPFPTSILSSQTGYPKFTFLDLTNEMTNYYKVWKDLNVNFDCIYSGFLGSIAQIDIVSKFIEENPNAFIVVDPIMGDDGVLYPIFNEESCLKIKELVKLSNLTTPNLTEACFLTGRDITKRDLTRNEIVEIAKDISKLGPDKVIITGILEGDNISNMAYDKTTDEIFFTFGIVETILAGSDHGCINVRKIFSDPKTKGVPIEVIHRKYQSTWAGKGPLLSF